MSKTATGDKGNEAGATMAKCTACGHEGDKKFCGDCGEPMQKALSAEERAAVLTDLGNLAKASAALESPEVGEHEEPEIETGAAVMSKARSARDAAPGDSTAGDVIIGAAIIDAHGTLLKSNSRIEHGVAQVVAQLVDTRKEVGILAKATHVLMLENAALREQVAALAAQPSGPRFFRGKPSQVSALQKSVDGESAGGEDDSPRGQALMAKALAAFEAGRLDHSDIGALTPLTNRNASLEEVKVMHSGLGNKIEGAITAAA